eukprot:763695-Hanusia_phi.AAC.10
MCARCTVWLKTYTQRPTRGVRQAMIVEPTEAARNAEEQEAEPEIHQHTATMCDKTESKDSTLHAPMSCEDTFGSVMMVGTQNEGMCREEEIEKDETRREESTSEETSSEETRSDEEPAPADQDDSVSGESGVDDKDMPVDDVNEDGVVEGVKLNENTAESDLIDFTRHEFFSKKGAEPFLYKRQVSENYATCCTSERLEPGTLIGTFFGKLQRRPDCMALTVGIGAAVKNGGVLEKMNHSCNPNVEIRFPGDVFKPKVQELEDINSLVSASMSKEDGVDTVKALKIFPEIFTVRTIEKDEEICFDYATTEWEMLAPHDAPFMCLCNSKNCRKNCIDGFRNLSEEAKADLLSRGLGDRLSEATRDHTGTDDQMICGSNSLVVRLEKFDHPTRILSQRFDSLSPRQVPVVVRRSSEHCANGKLPRHRTRGIAIRSTAVVDSWHDATDDSRITRLMIILIRPAAAARPGASKLAARVLVTRRLMT